MASRRRLMRESVGVVGGGVAWAFAACGLVAAAIGVSVMVRRSNVDQVDDAGAFDAVADV